MFFRKKEKPKATQITDDNFNEIALNTDKGILLDFYAEWCGPCKVLGPIIDELAGEFKDRVVVGKVDVDKNPKLSTFFKVKSMPTLIFVKNKQELERMSGLIPKPNLAEMLEDLEKYTFEEEK